MRAITTDYNGLRFRSRLEARWAVFLDAAGYRYRYEPEGFEFEGCQPGDGADIIPAFRYLPDFELPDLGIYLEVKGVADRATQMQIAAASMQLPVIHPSGVNLIVLGDIPNLIEGMPLHTSWGRVPEEFSDEYHPLGSRFVGRVRFKDGDIADEYGHPAGEGVAGFYYAEPNWAYEHAPTRCSYFPEYDEDSYPPRWRTRDIPMYIDRKTAAAYHKARASRFEFGETPKAGA